MAGMRGRPSKALQYIEKQAGIKSEVKKLVSKDVKKILKRGRKPSTSESLRVVGGRLIVKRAKSRQIRVGNKVYEA